uniref:G protein-coupled receptor 32 n=1 Tax=Piliocolobus tephrosceles TaxID=591936 RepID=A0A8C9H7Z6_9PRIM
MRGVAEGTRDCSDRQPGALTRDHSCSRKMNASRCLSEEVGSLRPLTVAVLSASFVVGVLGNGLVLGMTVFQWPLGEWACKLYITFVFLGHFASNCLLVLIPVDRCISVLYPVWALNHRTVQQASWLAFGVWLLAAVLCSAHMKFRTTRKWNGCRHCYLEFNSENETAQIWIEGDVESHSIGSIGHLLLGFLGPLAIIGTCAHLIRTKLLRDGWVHANRPKRLLLVLVSAFFICWYPFNVVLLVHLWRRVMLKELYHPRMLLILQAGFALGCVNSSLNPFLYVFIGRDFQEKFFQSLPSALARAFGEEFLSHPVPAAKPPGNHGSLQLEAGSRLP